MGGKVLTEYINQVSVSVCNLQIRREFPGTATAPCQTAHHYAPYHGWTNPLKL